MNHRLLNWILAGWLAPVLSWAEPVPETIVLPPPPTAGGMPLSEALDKAEDLYYKGAVRMFRMVRAGMKIQVQF